MTEYGKYTTINSANALLLTHDQAKAAKEARKKLLQEIEQRRRENYKRYYEKMALHQAKQSI